LLPFLSDKKKRVAGLIISKRKPEGGMEMPKAADEVPESVEQCAKDILKAIETKDAKMLAMAIRSAFEILDAEPHVEGEHLNEND